MLKIWLWFGGHSPYRTTAVLVETRERPWLDDELETHPGKQLTYSFHSRGDPSWMTRHPFGTMRCLICLDPNQDLEPHEWLCLCCLTYCYRAFGMMLVSSWCSIETRCNGSFCRVFIGIDMHISYTSTLLNLVNMAVLVFYLRIRQDTNDLTSNSPVAVCHNSSMRQILSVRVLHSKQHVRCYPEGLTLRSLRLTEGWYTEARHNFWAFTGSVIGKADSDEVISSCCSAFALLRRTCGLRLCMNWWQNKNLRSSLE